MRSGNRLVRLAKTTGALSIAFAACAPHAAAQEQPAQAQTESAVETPDQDPGLQQPPKRPIRYSVRVRGDMAFNANLDGEPGDVTVFRAGLDLGASIPIGAMGQLGLGIDLERSGYDFTGATEFFPQRPDLNFDASIASFRVSYAQQETADLGWLVGGSIGVAADDGADFDKSIIGSVFGGVRVALSESFRFTAGAIVSTQIEDNLLVLPLIGLEWQVNKRTSISSEGAPGVILGYALDDAWAVRAGFSYEYRNFRLDRNGPVPSGVARDSRLPVFVGVRYAPTPQIDIDATAGVYFFQNYRVDDSGGQKIDEADADATPFLRLGATFKF